MTLKLGQSPTLTRFIERWRDDDLRLEARLKLQAAHQLAREELAEQQRFEIECFERR